MVQNSYQLKVICNQCNKIISPRVDRIKAHLLKCGKPNDLGEYEEIGSLVRYWGNAKKNKKEFNKSYRDVTDSVTKSNGKDSGYEKTPYKLYGQDSINTPVDNTYMDGIINYEKNPHLRYRSDSEGSPEPKVKRPRYWSQSYDSDESPPTKRSKTLEN